MAGACRGMRKSKQKTNRQARPKSDTPSGKKNTSRRLSRRVRTPPNDQRPAPVHKRRKRDQWSNSHHALPKPRAGAGPFYSDRNASASSGYESGLREMPTVVPADKVSGRILLNRP